MTGSRKNIDHKPPSKSQVIESLIGSRVPSEVTVKVPEQSRNKGSGKRMKGEKEKSMEHQQKKTRQCKACGEYAGHDSRNCPSKLPLKSKVKSYIFVLILSFYLCQSIFLILLYILVTILPMTG